MASVERFATRRLSGLAPAASTRSSNDHLQSAQSAIARSPLLPRVHHCYARSPPLRAFSSAARDSFSAARCLACTLRGSLAIIAPVMRDLPSVSTHIRVATPRAAAEPPSCSLKPPAKHKVPAFSRRAHQVPSIYPPIQAPGAIHLSSDPIALTEKWVAPVCVVWGHCKHKENVGGTV